MSGNVLPAPILPIVAGLPNWLARASKTAESGFNGDTICFWGDSTTATCLNFFGGCPLPVTYPTFGAARFVNFHQKAGEALANTRLLNFGNTGASLAALLQDSVAATFGITRLLSANHQIYWPAANPPVAGDTVTIGGTVFTFIATSATPAGNQVQLGGTFGGSISNLVAALQGSTDAQVAKNYYASRSSNYDVSYAIDIWSRKVGPAGAGMAIACSTAGALINGTPLLQVPGLIVLCLGINDVRTGTTSQAQLTALLIQAVNRIRAVLPTTDIVLWGPNSLLADDPTGAGLVSPATAAAAQSYASLLYNAYASLRNSWPNVLVLQKQDIFGKTCVSYAASGGAAGSWMSDQLHPSLGAQTQMTDWLAPLIGFKQPFNLQRAALARIASPTAPYTVYSRDVEDPSFYDVVAQAPWLNQGTVSSNDYLDFLFPGARYREILPGDVVQMGSAGPVWQVPFSASIYNLNTTTTRIGSLGTGLLPVISGGTVTIYRQRYEWDATIQSYAQQLNAYPYKRRFYVPAAGSGYLRLYPIAQNVRDPAMANLNPNTDVIVGPGGFGAVTGWTTLGFTGTGNWQVSKSGTDFSALIGKYVWVFSSFPNRDAMEQAYEPVRLTLVGSITGTTYVRQIAAWGAGKVNRIFYTQGTAGTSDLTIICKVNGTTALTLLITAGHTTVQTTTWASGAAFPVFASQVIEWTISGGTGAADIAIAVDVGG